MAVSLLGKSVKDIRIVDTLGRGGMGEVYVGFDEKLKRKVALKSIRGEQMRLPDVRTRFLREARILSQLDHPNICRIYEYIEGDETDFLVLELIRGTTLRRRMRQGGLDEREKLGIAAQIADVLVAAHAAGVVHRDLKPENVMLTEAGDVKVLDFGLAQSHELEAMSVVFGPSGEKISAGPGPGGRPEATVFGGRPEGGEEGPAVHPFQTEVGMVMGTPSYMSPEQAVGRSATAASDLYSFGLILQELFTEESAYEKGLTLDELLPRVRDGKARPVIGLSKDLTDLIGSLKSVAPEARPSAQEAADRLEWIRDKPRRRLRRGVVALLVLLTLLGTLKYTFDLRRERARAVEARRQAEDLMSFMFEDLYGKLEPVGQLELLDSVANKARDYYGSFENEADERVVVHHATAQREIGRILEREGDVEAAEESFEKARRIFERLARDHADDPAARAGLADAIDLLAGTRQRQGELADAEALLELALEVASTLAAESGEPEHRALRARILTSIGGNRLARGDLQGALEAYRESRGISQGLVDVDAERRNWKIALASSWNGIGQALLRQGRNEEALDAFQRERGVYAQLVAERPAHSLWRENLAESWNFLGETYQNLERLERSLAAFQEAQEIIEELSVRDPQNADWRYQLAQSRERVGKVRKYQGELAAARVDYEEARVLMEELVASDPSNTDWKNRHAFVLVSLGDVVRDLGERAAAVALWEEAVRIGRDLVEGAADASQSTFYLDTLAMAYMYLERDEDAKPLVEILLDKGWQKKSFLELAERRGLIPAGS